MSTLIVAAIVAPAWLDCHNMAFSRALALARTRQAVCVERSREPGQWSLRRTATDRSGAESVTYTDTRACPAALQVLQAVENLELPRPDLPGFGKELEVITLDGAGYSLTTAALYGGDAGEIKVQSNVGTPLARWIDGALNALEPCWRARG